MKATNVDPLDSLSDLTELAQRLHSAAFSYQLDVGVDYYRRHYLKDDPVSAFWYALAKLALEHLRDVRAAVRGEVGRPSYQSSDRESEK